MVSLHQTDIDGPLRLGRARTTYLTAQLIIRTGMADESLNVSGWTHVFERLALHGRDGARWRRTAPSRS
ncbi:MAG: hypothetical protein U0R78_10470 [Nocardioidaceae bacterium]